MAARWLYEAGIGEARAALVDLERILEIHILPESTSPRIGAVMEARLIARADASKRGRVRLAGGEAEIVDLPPALTEGSKLRVEVIREPLGEAHRAKPLRVRPSDAAMRDGPVLLARITASGLAIERLGHSPDLLEQYGWSETLEEADSGLVARPESMLHISLTPAMVLIDVDGGGSAAPLAAAGAALAGEVIRRFNLTGSADHARPRRSARRRRSDRRQNPAPI